MSAELWTVPYKLLSSVIGDISTTCSLPMELSELKKEAAGGQEDGRWLWAKRQSLQDLAPPVQHCTCPSTSPLSQKHGKTAKTPTRPWWNQRSTARIEVKPEWEVNVDKRGQRWRCWEDFIGLWYKIYVDCVENDVYTTNLLTLRVLTVRNMNCFQALPVA